jgi:hypothetical protein
VRLFECHVTIEPVIDERLALAQRIAREYRFKVAELLMQKRPEDTPERSKFDTFMTGHSPEFQALRYRMCDLARNLQAQGFTVWRYKIEEIRIDSKTDDVYNLLKHNPK